MKRTREAFAGPFEAGRDAAKSGPNLTNTHWLWFRTEESTREWERGKSHKGVSR